MPDDDTGSSTITCPRCELSYTREQLETLHYIGTMGDEIETVALYNCVCGETLATDLDPPGDTP